MEMYSRKFTDHVNLRFTKPEGDSLRHLANKLGLSLSELIRLLVSKGLADLLREIGDADGNTAPR